MYDLKLFPEVEKIRRAKIAEYQNKLYSHKLYRDRDWLYGQYVAERRYLKDIAKDADTVDSTILRWVRIFNFPIITLSQRHKEEPRLWKRFQQAGSQIENRPRGKDNWRYVPIGQRNQIQLYRCVEYKVWKEAVHKRDDYICQGCGKKPKSLDTHHILPVRNFPQLVYAINNGISLCHSCHSKTISKEHTFVALFEKTVNSGKPKSQDMVIPNQAENDILGRV